MGFFKNKKGEVKPASIVIASIAGVVALFCAWGSWTKVDTGVADGRPRAYGNNVPHAIVGDWLVYNGKAFEITGTWNAASIDGPQDVPIPPPSNLIDVSCGSIITISGGDPVQYQDYMFWEQFQYGVLDPYYQLRIEVKYER
jgi:hypothetical protein